MTRPSGSGRCILVTGGAGFPGPHRTDRPLGPGQEAPCPDDLPAGPKRSPEPLHGHPRVPRAGRQERPLRTAGHARARLGGCPAAPEPGRSQYAPARLFQGPPDRPAPRRSGPSEERP